MAGVALPRQLLMTRNERDRFFAVLTKDWESPRAARIRCWPGPDRPSRTCQKFDLEAVDCARVPVQGGFFRCAGLRTFGGLGNTSPSDFWLSVLASVVGGAVIATALIATGKNGAVT